MEAELDEFAPCEEELYVVSSMQQQQQGNRSAVTVPWSSGHGAVMLMMQVDDSLEPVPAILTYSRSQLPAQRHAYVKVSRSTPVEKPRQTCVNAAANATRPGMQWVPQRLHSTCAVCGPCRALRLLRRPRALMRFSSC